MLGFSMGRANAAAAGDTVVNAFVRISPDGTAILYAKSPEMGQGIKTALTMIIAEQMDADWTKVRVEQAPINTKVFGEQWTNGSRSIREYSDQMHEAGATVRAMLIAAAAKQWSVSATECTTAKSMVTHKASGKSLSYGALAQAASTMPVPDAKTLVLKTRKDWKLLGTRVTGVDNAKVVTGQPLFGIDVAVPGMVYASYTKCPAQSGMVTSANLDHIKTLPGVKDAFVIQGNNNSEQVFQGVAIIATSTWAAFSAKQALKIVWDESGASKSNSTETQKAADALAKQEGKAVITETGDVNAAYASAAKTLEATYTVPFLVHANIEPQNTTAWVHDGVIEIWSPSQSCDKGQEAVAKIAGLPLEKVTVHQTRLGTGLGRRGHNDYMFEAVAIAQKVNAPVKLMWTREDDMAHDFYRPAAQHTFKASLDKGGKVTAWADHFVTLSHDGQKPVIAGQLNKNEFPAPLAPNVHVTQTMLPWGTRCGTWRAPRSNGMVFAIQSFLHELSIAAGRDHLAFLTDFLSGEGAEGYDEARAVATLKAAAAKAGWGTRKLPAGHALGIGFHPGSGGYITEIAEVSVDAKKKIKVHQAWAAVDAGPIISLSGAEGQVEGSMQDGFSTMGLQIDFENGRAKQSNFGEYPLLRINQAFPVDVTFIQSDAHPTGLGEGALPPIIPAVTNAVFTLTGVRIRSLPVAKHGFSI